ILPPQSVPLSTLLDDQRSRSRRDAHKRNALHVRPVGVARPKRNPLELIGEIFDRQILALGPREAPLESVGRKHLGMSEQRVHVEVGKLSNWNPPRTRARTVDGERRTAT